MRPTNECTSTSADQLLGSWQGQASTLIAYWPEPETSDCQQKLGAAELEGLLVQPDDSFARLPARVSQREAFAHEGGWLPAPGRMERLIWRYDACGRRAAYP